MFHYFSEVFQPTRWAAAQATSGGWEPIVDHQTFHQSKLIADNRREAGSRLETVGGSGSIAIHGLDPGIPAGMTTQWVLPCVRITPAGTIADH